MSVTSHACRCGHSSEAHEHYRRGSDCGICGASTCARFIADPAGDAVAAADGRDGSDTTPEPDRMAIGTVPVSPEG